MSGKISKLIGGLFLFLSLAVFAGPSTVETQSVDASMRAFIQAYEKGDLNALMQFYAPNAVVIGTGKDEVVQGLAQIRSSFEQDLKQHSAATITMKPIAVDVQKNIAFASYSLMVDVKLPDNKSFQSPLRWSVGLVKQGKKWLVVQSHLSAPLAGQEKGQAFPKS